MGRADAGVDADGGETGERCGRCPFTLRTVAASERARGEGDGASAVEAGQSCSRHQGRHFL